MTNNRILLALLLLFSGACASAPRRIASLDAANDGAKWGPVIQLRDDTRHFPGTSDRPKPDGGWWVTPIHATLLPDGQALVTGWGRFDYSDCRIHRTRQNGESYLIDPNAISEGDDRTLFISPLDEKPRPGNDDVLYCSGNLTLPDGRVLFVGGARYKNLGDKPGEEEYGLNYSRLFDPIKKSFSRLDFAPGGSPKASPSMSWYENGMMWYPTATHLPGGKLLVVGGFDRSCADGTCANRDIEIFDPSQISKRQNPWSTLLAHEQAPAGAYDLGIKDYTHSFLLNQPMPAALAGGISREVILIGEPGKIVGVSLDQALPSSARVFVPPAESAASLSRPAGAVAWDSSAALLGTGEILVVGGGANPMAEGQRLDLFNPQTGTWRSKDSGITRHNPATTLLPDGSVLIVNGEAGDDTAHAMGDRHRPQIYDPYTDQLTTLAAWPDVNPADRGYHNFSLLLKDGRILLGGGMVTLAQVGCERPDLRVFSPPYLTKGPRPQIAAATEGRTIRFKSSFKLKYSGPEPRSERGVVLMALGSETHSFDQGQRYVPLSFHRQSQGSLMPSSLLIEGPNNSTVAPEGEYLLFLISEQGVPSVGRLVHVAP